MTYSNTIKLTQHHDENFICPKLYISESAIEDKLRFLNDNLYEIIKDSFIDMCEYVDGYKQGMFEIDDIQFDLTYSAVEKQYSLLELIVKRFIKMDNVFYSAQYHIDYTIVIKENYDRNYLKMKDFDLYNRLYGYDLAHLNVLMYNSFYKLLIESLYPHRKSY